MTLVDTGVEVIFYNIWVHYRDLDYAFFRGKLIDLSGEWLEEERLNAPNVTPPSAPLGPSTGNAAEIEIVSAETSKQSSVVEVDEMTSALDPSITFKDPASKPSLRVMTVQLLINLKEEPVATDTEEEPEATINPTVV